jgi:hypothetical protein
MAAVSPAYDRWAYALPMTHGSHCPPCFRFLRLCVTQRLGKLPRCFLLSVSSGEDPSIIASIHAPLHHLRSRSSSSPSPSKGKGALFPCGSSIHTSPFFLCSILCHSERRFLLPPLLSPSLSLGAVAFDLPFWDSVFRSYVLNDFWIAPFP